MARKLRKPRKWQPLSRMLLFVLAATAAGLTVAVALWVGVPNLETALLLVVLSGLFLVAAVVLTTLWAERLTETSERWDVDEELILLQQRQASRTVSQPANPVDRGRTTVQLERYLNRLTTELASAATRTASGRPASRRGPASPSESTVVPPSRTASPVRRAA